jgi:hypothetical protein
MDLTEGSETSAKLNLTPGKYPKENIQVSEHGENLKSRITHLYTNLFIVTTVVLFCCYSKYSEVDLCNAGLADLHHK